MLEDWRFYALASAVFAALTAIFGKIGVASVNSNLATLIRTIVILIFISLVVGVRREWSSEGLNSRGMGFLILSGLATGASWLFYYRALQLGPASKVAPVDKMSVAITVIFAFLFLGENISLKTGLGAALILAGSIVLVL